jgi:hypothetical protein
LYGTKKVIMTNKTQTTEKTFNKKVKAQVVNLMPNARTFKKSHVAGAGYVFYIKDENNNTLGKVCKEKKGMLIYVG